MPLRPLYLDEQDRAFLQDAARTAGASLFHAIRIYLMVALAGALLLLPFFFYGFIFMAGLLLATRNTVLFLFLPLFVFTSPSSIFWKYFLAVPVISGLGGWIIYRTEETGAGLTLYVWGSLVFLIILSFSACILNRRRSNPLRKADPVLRSVIMLALLTCIFLIFRLVFPIAGETILVAAPAVAYSWFIFALIGAGVWLVWRAATKLR
jgi:hypothetical protein